MEKSSVYESAQLILKLYELRRDPKMREARDWFITRFHPSAADDVIDVLSDGESWRYRMVTGYWDMAASFVNYGAIDMQMFLDACPESISTFSKLEHILPELRETLGAPNYLMHWEQVMRALPDGSRIFQRFREQLSSIE
ncbi:MAG: hypothetical protein R3338_04665 [Thermoanaerobaculia bacterium]|nr:hypothetical protein [Thermoanaerobaculia bacterium]